MRIGEKAHIKHQIEKDKISEQRNTPLPQGVGHLPKKIRDGCNLVGQVLDEGQIFKKGICTRG